MPTASTDRCAPSARGMLVGATAVTMLVATTVGAHAGNATDGHPSGEDPATPAPQQGVERDEYLPPLVALDDPGTFWIADRRDETMLAGAGPHEAGPQRSRETVTASRSAMTTASFEVSESPDALVPEPQDPQAPRTPDPDPEASTTTTEAPESSEQSETTSSGEPESSASTDTVWDRLGACESGHGGPARWDHDRFHHLDPYSDARFYGGLHFNKSSWDWAVEVGGHDVAYWPHEASRQQQIAVAETLRSIHPAGWGAWPECARRLGLR